jgi:hypothetical protein
MSTFGRGGCPVLGDERGDPRGDRRRGRDDVPTGVSDDHGVGEPVGQAK